MEKVRKILDIPSEDAGYIDVFKGLSSIVQVPLIGIVDNFVDSVVYIELGTNIVELPGSFEVLQTEEGEIDFIASDKLLDIPLFTVNGKFAINELYNHKSSVGEYVEWVVPSIPRGHYFILGEGIVVNPYPRSRDSNSPEIEL